MTTTFDNKVYDIIKNNDTPGPEPSISFDDIYPVGSVVKSASKTPFSSGTWKIVGAYGIGGYSESVNAADDPANGTSISHHMVFNGRTIIDYISTSFTSATAINFKYEKFSSFTTYCPQIILNDVLDGYGGDYIDQLSYNFGITVRGNMVSLTKANQQQGMNASIMIELSADETYTNDIFNNLTYEFLRTA